MSKEGKEIEKRIKKLVNDRLDLLQFQLEEYLGSLEEKIDETIKYVLKNVKPVKKTKSRR